MPEDAINQKMPETKNRVTCTASKADAPQSAFPLSTPQGGPLVGNQQEGQRKL
jgi:hypothetical protein